MSKRRKLNFDDLNFQPISPDSRVLKATLTFSNGYGCNVYMHSPNTNKWLPYEFEVLKNGKKYHCSEISDDNVGYSSKDDICLYLDIVQRI